MWTRSVFIGLIAVSLAVANLAAPVAIADARTNCSSRVLPDGFHPHIVEQRIASSDAIPDDAVSVPTWSGAFATSGQTYPYRMVGTDPAAGSATTTVPVVIVPLQLDFEGGCVLAHDGMADDISASPMFTATPFATGTSQYMDAIQRGNFWSSVSTISPDWHVLLGTPQVTPVQELHVPGAQGLTAFNAFTNQRLGIVNGKWFDIQLLGLLNSMHIDPRTFAMFVPYNTYLTDENPTDCLGACSYYTGYHAAVLTDRNARAVNTYALASYIDYGAVLPPGFDLSVEVASHEVLEWANDPFDHGQRVRGQPTFFANTAPHWHSPYYDGSCNEVLEVADPVEGVLIGATPGGGAVTYLLADVAFLSWFARESPSSAIYGRYDAAGVFSTYSNSC